MLVQHSQKLLKIINYVPDKLSSYLENDRRLVFNTSCMITIYIFFINLGLSMNGRFASKVFVLSLMLSSDINAVFQIVFCYTVEKDFSLAKI